VAKMMEKNELNGIRVKLDIIEPWEFNPNTVEAEIKSWNEQTGFAVVKFEKRILFKGQECIFFRMKVRQGSQTLLSLRMGNTIDCNLILLDENIPQVDDANFLNGWKNNIGVIASVKMIE
jgi:hypothetical protein